MTKPFSDHDGFFSYIRDVRELSEQSKSDNKRRLIFLEEEKALTALSDPEPSVRAFAVCCCCLPWHHRELSQAVIVKMLSDPNEEVAMAALVNVKRLQSYDPQFEPILPVWLFANDAARSNGSRILAHIHLRQMFGMGLSFSPEHVASETTEALEAVRVPYMRVMDYLRLSSASGHTKDRWRYEGAPIDG